VSLPLLADRPDLGFQPGDHICAFYNGGKNLLDDIVVDFVSKGLQAGSKCICFLDDPTSVRERVPGELTAKDDILQFFTEEQGYLPEGSFSKEAFLRGMEDTVKGTLSAGYERLCLIGDTTVVIRKSVDLKEAYAELTCRRAPGTRWGRSVEGMRPETERFCISLKAWFATESEVSEFAPRYPQFIMCLYDLDLYDGETVMYVLRTHTRIFVNGLIITNPYYIPKRQFLGGR
jgi:hypothetical protein